MSNITATLCRNRLSVTRHAKPLAAFWRTQGTQAAPRGRDEIFRDSAATEIGDDGGVRPFEDIPEPRKNLRFLLNFYVKTEGFRKLYRLNDHLFAELGPIFKENILYLVIRKCILLIPMIFKKFFVLKESILGGR